MCIAINPVSVLLDLRFTLSKRWIILSVYIRIKIFSFNIILTYVSNCNFSSRITAYYLPTLMYTWSKRLPIYWTYSVHIQMRLFSQDYNLVPHIIYLFMITFCLKSTPNDSIKVFFRRLWRSYRNKYVCSNQFVNDLLYLVRQHTCYVRLENYLCYL